MVFYGEYTVSLTPGQRLVLPKKIRELIKGPQFVVTKGFDKCLAGYDLSDWQNRSQEFLSRSLINTQDLEIRRLIFAGAVYVDLDEQGRFVLPKNLYDYLELNGKTVFVGVGDHFEIWSQAKWQDYVKQATVKTELLQKNE